MSIALTVKPARSGAVIGSLPSCSLANAVTRSTVLAAVSIDGMISTSLRTGTGLKKCSPRTCGARPCVALPSSTIGIEEVFEASTASSPATTSERRRNTSSLVALS